MGFHFCLVILFLYLQCAQANRFMPFKVEKRDSAINMELISNKAKIDYLLLQLKDTFNTISPLIFLSHDQQMLILGSVQLVEFGREEELYRSGDKSHLSCYFLIQGKVQILNKDESIIEILESNNFFGYQGAILNKRTSTVIVAKNTILGVLSSEVYLNLLGSPDAKFKNYILSSIISKEKNFSKLDGLKNFILSFIDKEPINIEVLVSYYLKIESSLHPKADSSEIDYNAWSYALRRLPENLLKTYSFLLTNKKPEIVNTNDQTNSVTEILNEYRIGRRIYEFIDGKTVIVVRELETDVLDFVANLCIHIIESRKIQKIIETSESMNELLLHKNSNASQLISELPTMNQAVDFSKISKILNTDTPAVPLIDIMLLNSDYSISIKKEIINDRDSIDIFTQSILLETKRVLGINENIESVKDLVVDIIQGSKRAVINLISPHIYKNKDKIESWASKEISMGKLNLKTTAYQNTQVENQQNDDLLIAYSYYYYKAHPEEAAEKAKLELENGISFIEETKANGVPTIIINPSKFNLDFIDMSLEFSSAQSKNHLIILIGYAFGAQAKDIVKPLLYLFGSNTRSFNIIGKAGGLIGNRKDILVASKMYYDKTGDISTINNEPIDINKINELVNPRTSIEKSTIHVGPMLTVTGTILQNETLLNFYKNGLGIVGVEMEGYFYAKEIEIAIKSSVLKHNLISRCFYYISDLPLDPNQSLSSEEEIVSWDEGVQSINAITRFILREILH